jgi:CspA family cold shock protein
MIGSNEENEEEVKRKESVEYPETPRQIGNVKWFDDQKKYGYIRRKNGDDVFVHASSINRDPPTLNEHERVEFSVGPGEKGPEALDVTIVTEIS